ncbi:MAG: helix-turn-helix transcriptional regulator [Saprospiraceae bacterium]|nr:helix-turn-helix transcriptional regulator [Saprospiraceae bacterium]
MSKFVLTGVLLLILAGFLHYSPSTNATSMENGKNATETLLFPISEQIKLARLEKHLSQKDLADRVGLTKMNIEKIEKGQVVPTRDILFKLEKELNATFTLDGY